jgi:hypothetical protein
MKNQLGSTSVVLTDVKSHHSNSYPVRTGLLMERRSLAQASTVETWRQFYFIQEMLAISLNIT